ncbi:MAG: TRAP transporter small permease [Paracoccaceae bacterium]
MRLYPVCITAMAVFAAFLFVAAGAMLTWEVGARYLFVKPTIWAAELSQICLIWGSLLAMPWCLRERRHIRITAVIALLSPGPRRIADIAAMLGVALFSGFVAWYGWQIFWTSLIRGRTAGTMLDPPMWIIELSAPFGFAFLLIQALIEAKRAWCGEIVADGAHE